MIASATAATRLLAGLAHVCFPGSADSADGEIGEIDLRDGVARESAAGMSSPRSQ